MTLLKLRSAALEILADRKAYYGGGLFTGVAITEEQGRILSACELREGVEVGDYRNRYLEAPEGAAQISASHPGLEGEPEYSEPLTLDGERFDGIVYEFDGIHCVRESLFEDGAPKVEVTWHPCGAIATYEYFYGGTAAEFYWSANGARTSLRLMNPQGADVTMNFLPTGELSDVRSLGNYFAGEADPALEELPFPAITEPAELADVRAAEDLTLDGESVTAELLQQLAANRGLAGLRRLTAYDTGLQAGDVELLLELPDLGRVVFKDKSGQLGPALLALKARRPEVEVVYNQQTLAAPLEADPCE